MKYSLSYRAQLLEALARGGQSEADYVARQLGFVPAPEEPDALDPVDPPVISEVESDPVQAEAEQSPSTPQTLPDIPFWRVTASEIFGEDESVVEESTEGEGVQSTEWIPGDEPAHSPLTPWHRLLPRIRAELDDHIPVGEVDVGKTVEQLSRAEWVDRLPRELHRGWGSQLQLIVDGSVAMIPFLDDVSDLHAKLRRYLPVGAIEVVRYDPGGRKLVRYCKRSSTRRYAVPPEDTLVLALSDFGLFSGNSESRRFWARLGGRLRQAGCRPLALFPAAYVPEASGDLRDWRIIPWELARPKDGISAEEHAERLMTLLSPAIRIEPGLLRSVRRLIGADASAEAMFWLHPALLSRSNVAATIEPKAALQYREKLEQESPEIRLQVLMLLEQWRTHLPPEILHEEDLGLLPGSRSLLPAYRVRQSVEFFHKLEKRLVCGETIEGLDEWFRDLEERTSELSYIPEIRAAIHRIWGVVHREDRDAVPPEGYEPPSELNREVERWQVFQHGDELNFVRLEDVKSRGWLLGAKLPLPFVEVWNTKGSWLGEIRSRSGEIVLEEIEPQDEETFWVGGEAPLWADAWGEDEFGCWVEFVIKDVRQRMRWIPAGEFLMGSPEDEAERSGWEGPQHRVVISQGFWMFDTAVPQKLWSAVMGENPSRFKGDELPVEKVSWEDCGRFIERINGMLPGLRLGLPSEAQWEYACRAGTQTVFHFGDQITTDQANYNGNYPYAGGEKGEYRQTTVPVKSFKPNDSGLWQMHGNVWEWTQDRWHGSYEGAPGSGAAWEQGDSADRVVRGGSWGSGGRDLRSAYRNHRGPGFRNDYLGFRPARVQVTGQAQEIAEPLRGGAARSGTRRAAPHRSGGAEGAGARPARTERGQSQRTLIEDGSGVLHLPPGRDFELHSDMGRLRIQQMQKPEWASAVGRDRYGLWAEFEIAHVVQRMRWIPPGQFLMGSPESERVGLTDNKDWIEWMKKEGPQHTVTISKGYWLFDTPVTQALWQAVLPDEKNPARFQSRRRPVEQVSWEDAMRFIKRINEIAKGLNLTLPTEVQWEYACRAGTKEATYGGPMEVLGENHVPVLDAIAWYGGNSGKDFDLDDGYDSSGWPDKQYEHSKAGTREVALKHPNGWGVYDMLGNVFEWCRDGMRDYSGEPQADPVGSLEDSAYRVVRGGSWNNNGRNLRSAYRNHNEPGNRNNNLGFRPARAQEGGGCPDS